MAQEVKLFIRFVDGQHEHKLHIQSSIQFAHGAEPHGLFQDSDPYGLTVHMDRIRMGHGYPHFLKSKTGKKFLFTFLYRLYIACLLYTSP